MNVNLTTNLFWRNKMLPAAVNTKIMLNKIEHSNFGMLLCVFKSSIEQGLFPEMVIGNFFLKNSNVFGSEHWGKIRLEIITPEEIDSYENIFVFVSIH